MLRATSNLRLNAGIPQRCQKLRLHLLDERGRVARSLFELTRQRVVRVGIDDAKGQILESDLNCQMPSLFASGA